MRLALISVLVLALAACGGNNTVDISTNQDNFCDQIADVICHNLYQCCAESDIEQYLEVSEPRTELQCREDIRRNCDRTAPDVRDSLKAGRITFDPNKLNACLEAILAPEATCSEVVVDLPWKEQCSAKNAPWVGTVATDGQCFYTFDCAGAPDSFCGPDQKCHLKPTAGFPCGTGCASAYYCGTNNICAPRLALGAPCTQFPTGQCGENLFCDNKGTFTVSTDDVCATKGVGGTICTAEDACVSGDCVQGKCQQTNLSCFNDSQCQSHCAELTNTPCDGPEDCGTGFCTGNPGTSCSSDLTCSNLGFGTCNFPRACLPGDCVGDPDVCTSERRTADYCTNFQYIPQP
jgi:hypothetical protein